MLFRSANAKITITILDKDGTALSKDEYTFANEADTQNWSYNNHGVSFTLTHTDAVTLELSQKLDTTTNEVELEAVVDEDNSLTFQIGSNSNQSMDLDISDMSASALAVDKLSVVDYDNAQAAIDSIEAAIGKVSAERSKLGAVQNRLEHTIKNLDTSSENLQASESRIRDVDMAKEMMEFAKNNILQQAAQAMLAQANQQPQGVLQLLR
mgnify:CR=1 FL=1